MPSDDTILTFNGIHGATGEYSIAPMSAVEFSRLALGTVFDPPHLKELKQRHSLETQPNYAPKVGVDRKKLEETGWGVIFAFDLPDADRNALYEALSPLFQLRREQARGLYKDGGKYREFGGPDTLSDAYRDGESSLDFLSRMDVGPGPVDTDVLPYYLLLVGDPDSIPFRFQYQLDVQFAVGRIHFDTLEEYAVYARSVVAAETGSLALARRAAIFATANNGDGATQMSHKYLATPLAEWAATQPAWKVERYLDGAATKANLQSLLGSDAPAFLFTASHGMCYDSGDTRQAGWQGALLCQDWPGQSYVGPTPESFFFSGDDVADDASVFGTIAMHFACFGAGTPQLSDFSTDDTQPTIAPKSFLGRLPQRLLAHRRGGALAVVGHVERAWGCSFYWDGAGSQTQVFKDMMKLLMEGHPVGSALEPFNSRYAEISTSLSSELENVVRYRKPADPYKIAGLWTANNDARNYSVVGDPAVRLMLDGESRPLDRPVLEVISLPASSSKPSLRSSAKAKVGAPQPVSAQQPVSVQVTVPIAIPAPPNEVASPPASGLPPTPPPPTEHASSAAFASGMVDYGWGGDKLKSAAQALQEAAAKIGDWLAESLKSVTTVHVYTYTSDTMDPVDLENGKFPGAKLRAFTVASLDGNTQVCVPEKDGHVDEALWKIHSEIFDKALVNRVEMLKAAATSIASLVPGVKLP